MELGTILSEDVSLMAAGLDSIAATEISRMLHDRFRIELPATLLFDHPTARSMARFVSSKLQKHLMLSISDGICDFARVLSSCQLRVNSFALKKPPLVASVFSMMLPILQLKATGLRELTV